MSLRIPQLQAQHLTTQPPKRLSLWSKRYATSDLAGSFKRAVLGSGLNFKELREYMPGDEIKHIDWKASARSSKTYIKTYEEDRSLRLHIALDMSASMAAAGRFELYQRLSLLILQLALRGHDTISLSLYSDKMEQWFAPTNAPRLIQKMIQEIALIQGLPLQTNHENHIKALQKEISKKTIILYLSDLYGPLPDLKTLSARHPLIIASCIEAPLPPAEGIMITTDPETGTFMEVDSDDGDVRSAIIKTHEEHILKIKDHAIKSGARFLPLSYSPVQSLLTFGGGR